MSAEGRIADALAQRGWAVVSSFLPTDSIRALAEDARENMRADAFRPAGVGAGAQHTVRQDVRRDAIHWLEPRGAGPALQACFAQFEALRLAINRELQLGLFDFEAHYACYAPGAFYRRHLDRLAGDDRRVLSCVLYLNDHWTPADGGQLRLYLPDGVQEVLPEAGTLVTFLSERFEHEVLSGRRERLSLAGWFRRSSQPSNSLRS